MIKYKRVFTGSLCNNNCLYCEFVDQRRENRFLQEIKSDLRNQEGYDSLEIAGGEASTRTDFIDIINFARQQNYIRIKLKTNGRAFSDWELARTAIEYGVHLFEVKIYGYSPAIHDLITREPGSLSETIQGIANLKSLQIPGEQSRQPFVAIKLPLCKENSEYIEDTVRFLIPLGIDRITLSYSDCDLSMEDVIPHVSNAIETAIFSRIWIQTERIPLCLMSGYEHHVSENFLDGTDYELKKGKNCPKCVYSASCEGIAGDYLEKKGSKEFQAVTKSLYAADLNELRSTKAGGTNETK